MDKEKSVKVQRIEKPKDKKKPLVVDERRENLIDSLSPQKFDNEILKTINAPIRTAIYVEIGDSNQQQVRELLTALNQAYEGNEGGIHYIVPMRHGKLNTEIEFEQEFLETIRKICTINNGQIEFKDGYKETIVIREKI